MKQLIIILTAGLHQQISFEYFKIEIFHLLILPFIGLSGKTEDTARQLIFRFNWIMPTLRQSVDKVNDESEGKKSKILLLVDCLNKSRFAIERDNENIWNGEIVGDRTNIFRRECRSLLEFEVTQTLNIAREHQLDVISFRQNILKAQFKT